MSTSLCARSVPAWRYTLAAAGIGEEVREAGSSEQLPLGFGLGGGWGMGGGK